MRQRKKSRRADARILEIAVLMVLPILFHYLIPIMTVIPVPCTYVGIVVMPLGAAIVTWAALMFRKAGTNFQLSGGASVLMTSGPFHFSRNPTYLGMLIWLLGLAVLLGSLTALLFPLLFFLLANFIIIPLEENRMEQSFGERFIEFRQRVRRWL